MIPADVAGGSATTEVEHAMIVAFERLGQAQAAMATGADKRSKLEQALAKEREQVANLTKEVRQLKAEREVQAKRLAELGSTLGGVAAGSGAAATKGLAAGGNADVPNAEALKKRLGAFQTAKQEEVSTMAKQLQEAHDATQVEALERQKSERQAVDVSPCSAINPWTSSSGRARPLPPCSRVARSSPPPCSRSRVARSSPLGVVRRCDGSQRRRRRSTWSGATRRLWGRSASGCSSSCLRCGSSCTSRPSFSRLSSS
jgi:hypothetical protein